VKRAEEAVDAKPAKKSSGEGGGSAGGGVTIVRLNSPAIPDADEECATPVKNGSALGMTAETRGAGSVSDAPIRTVE
jgi:hypothetical protein